MAMKIVGAPAILFSFFLAGSAIAESPTCTDAYSDAWMQPDAMQEKIEAMGYKINSMGISLGNCYEMSGFNVQGQSVTAYLHPLTGVVVQENLSQ